MIIIENLTHTYPGSRRQPPRTALHGLSMTIGRGEFCILSGPNGSGKSTLFRILCGMALPSAGRIAIGGHDLIQEPGAVRRLLGVVFQSPAVDKHLTVAENIGLHADLYGLRGAERQSRIAEAVSWTELKDRMGEKVDTLSGGLARQVELAKVLLTRPEVLLLDEPSTGLDPAARYNFLKTLRGVQQERSMTVLMTSHIFSEAEDADHVAVMKAGHLLAFDTPQALRAMVGREMVVIQTTEADTLADALRRDLGLTVRRHGDELRLDETENGASLPLLEKVLERYRPMVRAIAIRQPTLEDAFIHMTSTVAPAAAPLTAGAAE